MLKTTTLGLLLGLTMSANALERIQSLVIDGAEVSSDDAICYVISSQADKFTDEIKQHYLTVGIHNPSFKQDFHNCMVVRENNK